MTFAVASTVLHDLLRAVPRPARICAVTEAAVYLEVTDPPADGPGLVAVVTRDAVRVPIALVVAAARRSRPFAGLSVGQGAVLGDGQVRLGDGTLILRPLRYWDPRVPPLRAGLASAAAVHRAATLISAARTDPTRNAEVRSPWVVGAADRLEPLAAALARRGAAGRGRDDQEWERAVIRLLGFGPGLTPAGDDVLAGALVTLVAAGDTGRSQGLAAAVRRHLGETTPISAALLDQAGHGRAVPEVTAALRAVAGHGDLEQAGERLNAVGHTSGAALGLGIQIALGVRTGLAREWVA